MIVTLGIKYCIRAVYRNFAKGERITGMEKRGGGGEAQ